MDNNPNSHAMIWRQFIICLLKHLSKYDTGIVYVLFGKQAQTFKYYINNKMNNIIEVNHPAYYARTETKMPHEIFKEIDYGLNFGVGYNFNEQLAANVRYNIGLNNIAETEPGDNTKAKNGVFSFSLTYKFKQ